MKKTTQIDMINGPVLKKLLFYAIPLMLSGILQLLFNAADMVVVGRWAGADPFAAVGASAPLTGLLVNIFIGFAGGASVLVAQSYGSRNEQHVHKTVHTAMLTGLISGIFAMLVGLLGSRTFLIWMKTPPEIMELSVLYVRIYFLGLPAMMVYNFGASVLRSVGDTQHPLWFLTIGGVVNVVLNMLAVLVLKWSVAGVAIATVVSQIVSAVLVVRFMMRQNNCCRLILRELKIYAGPLKEILRLGIPTGIQSAMFSFSNVVIQSSVNSLGSLVMQGSAAASNLESFAATAEVAFMHTTITFVGQNAGAKKYRRIPKIVCCCVLLTTIVGLVLGNGIYLLREPLLRIYLPDAAEAVQYGVIRTTINMIPHFLYGVMEVLGGALRGMGASLLPTSLSLTGTCFARMVWIFTVFAKYPSAEMLFLCYPLTWTLTILLELCALWIFWRRLKRKNAEAFAPLAAESAV